MTRLLTTRTATYLLLAIFGATILFHLTILVGLIPYQVVWGGKLQSQTQMVAFETISIAVNLLMLGIVAAYAGLVRVAIKPKLLKGLLWAMCGLFVLNPAGNLLSENDMEKAIFTPVTLLLALLCLRLALEKQPAIV